MSKIAFIFPGQGAQKAGMGQEFYEKSEVAKEIFDKATERLNLDMKALCFEENDKLDRTEYTQAALVTTCLAMARTIEMKGLRPDVCAGLSLGEYCAVAMAGGMRDQDAIMLVKKRGEYMQEACPAGKGAMAAVLGMKTEKIEEVVSTMKHVSVANYNCPGQIVITGEKEAVEEATEKLKENGAKRVIMLNVSGPFHSAYMKPAKEKLEEDLKNVTMKKLKIPYVTNLTAEYVTDIKNTKEILAKAVCSSVRWQQSVENMIADGVDTFVEIGPGKTLTGFLKKIDRTVKFYNVETWDDMEHVLSELAGE